MLRAGYRSQESSFQPTVNADIPAVIDSGSSQSLFEDQETPPNSRGTSLLQREMSDLQHSNPLDKVRDRYSYIYRIIML